MSIGDNNQILIYRGKRTLSLKSHENLEKCNYRIIYRLVSGSWTSSF